MSLKSFIKKAGKGISKAKGVLLPLAGVAAGLALPGIGGAVGKLFTKGKDLLAKGKLAVGEKKGFLGIGDKKPGIGGIGTGKGLKKALGLDAAEDGRDGVDGAPGAPGASGSIPGWAKAGAAGLGIWALMRR